MPRINRIRIINFSYNNDNREIQDETYRFYDGENALLNLSNGGGKSVLVQVFLQPIIPDFKIQKRVMADYLRRSTNPSFIMIEWLLDNESRKDYLLTGIVIAPKGGSNEDSNKINYYTFMSHYDKAAGFDISCVPFAEKEHGKLNILPYERSREAVRKLAERHREVYYFSRDDSAKYRRELIRFGIYQDEWKNIIARMNNDEGGIDELFERCAASDTVFNEWILKTVEKAVMSDRSGDAKIYELLDGLVDETLKNETFIQDQKLLIDFFKVHQGLEEQLLDICNKLETYEGSKGRLSSMYATLTRQNRRLAVNRDEVQGKQEDLNAERSRIEQEESSENYYKAQEAAEETDQIYQEEYQKLKEAEQDLKNLVYEQKRLRAAKFHQSCEELKASIAVLEMKLEARWNDDETHQMLKDLQYSLKIGYEKLLQTLEQELDAAKAGEVKNKSDIGDVGQQITMLDQAIKSSGQRLGVMEEKIRAFKVFEEQVLIRLGLDLRRNVLEELNAAEVEASRKNIELKVEAAGKMLGQMTNEGEELDKEIRDKMKLQTETEVRLNGAQHRYEQTTAELTKLHSEEQACFALLKQYDVESGLLYEKDRLAQIWKQKFGELEYRKANWELERNQIQQMAAGIKENHVYLPEIFLKALEEADIDYISGEAYLENLGEVNRQQILEDNSLLPYAVVVKAKDAGDVYELPLERLLLRQLIPVITYEQLNASYKKEHQAAIIDEHLSIISAYDKRIFLDAGKRTYLEELQRQCGMLEENIRHLNHELTNARMAGNQTESFPWSRADKAELNQRIQDLQKEVTECTQQKKMLIQQIKQAGERQKEINRELEQIKVCLADTRKESEDFLEFQEKNRDYMEHLAEKSELGQTLVGNEKKRKELEQRQEELWHKAAQLQGEITALTINFNNIKGQSALFAEAAQAKVLDGTIEYLRQQYDDLHRRLEGSLQEIEASLEEKRGSLSETYSDLQDLELPAEAYEGLKYEKETERNLSKKNSMMDAKLKCRHDSERKAQITQARAHSAWEQASKSLMSTGLTEPLERTFICGNYDNRRKKLRFEAEQLKEALEAIDKTRGLYTQLSGRIEDFIPVRNILPIAGFELAEDALSQFTGLREEYRAARQTFKQVGNEYTKKYSLVRNEYENRNQCITDILNSLKNLDLSDLEISYESLFYNVEEFIKKKENLRKLLDFYEVQMQNMMETKRQIIDQCISYATLLYEDVKQITTKSRIRLTGKNRPIQMLKIDIPETLDTQVRERMAAHIDNSLNLMVGLSRSDIVKTDKKYRDKMRSVMSSRELFNQLIGTGKIQVSVYKVDLNPNNSGMKKWEDAMAQNSGGEKFVVFFTLVSTLISYTREAAGRSEGIDMSRDSKVILMDNPFGRTSSEHLLKAVIDIARTFHIQLICLSDLSQSSITNRFALIYQLAVRKKMYSDKEMLKVSSVEINKDGVSENERLEHTALYERYEQESLFDPL